MGVEPVKRDDLARVIYQMSHLEGQFRLRSGGRATEYFDKYLFESDPVVLRAVTDALVPLIPPGVEVVAGLELGGVPIATLLSQVTGLPAVFVRKVAKDYGTCKLAEGSEVKGKRLLVVEDVVTTGGQIVLSVQALRRLDAIVEHAICVIDRESGGREALVAAGVKLTPLFQQSELVT